jgi:hypothetical protein
MRPARPPRNFHAYWKMEAANVGFVPLFAWWLGPPRDAIEWLAFVPAAIATMGFLVVGTLFWRGVDYRLRRRDRSVAPRALAFADRVERPLLIVLAAAFIASVAALARNGWTPAVIAALAMTALAALEYVNYYHKQLQHFDNRADVKRLLSGRGGRASHMARDLSAWRRARPASRRGAA